MISYEIKNKITLDKTLGYKYFIDKYHPIANKQGKVYYHRHMGSLKTGRWLDRTDVVHHIDKNKMNNEFSNLMIISSSEHAKIHRPEYVPFLKKECKKCGKIFETKLKKRIFCSDYCRKLSVKKIDITKEELENLIWKIPTTKIAARFGATDKAIEKWCKKYHLSKPPRGYWTKHASIV